MHDLIHEAMADFAKVAELAHAKFPAKTFTVEIAMKPHRAPATLPAGKIAVYIFFLQGQALKVGIAGPISKARYTSQHYNPRSANSCLARSILKNPGKLAVSLTADSVGYWIEQNTDRVNLLAPVAFGLRRLSLLESFLHVRWNPLFEGRGALEQELLSPMSIAG